MLHEDVTRVIIKAFYTVYNKLGYGFLEKVYENSLGIELSKPLVDTFRGPDLDPPVIFQWPSGKPREFNR